MGAQTPPGLSDEKATRILIGLRNGRTLRKFWITPARLEAYFKTHPDYAREARPLIKANAEAARLRKGAHIRNKTHCINGHAFAEHGRVAMHKGWMTRQCRACETMRARRGDKIKPDVLAAVKAALKRGLTISAITAAGRSTRLVKHNTLARHRRENPEFDLFVSELTKDNNSRGQLLRWQRIRNAAVRDQNNDYYKILAMMPGNLPAGVRDDVAQSIFVALLDGSLQRDQVKTRVQQFVTAHNRQAREGTGKYGHLSFDAPIFAEGSMTRGDTISRGLWD
jgi:hypothetical protein